jgi:hypothetical protein
MAELTICYGSFAAFRTTDRSIKHRARSISLQAVFSSGVETPMGGEVPGRFVSSGAP